MFSCIHVHTAFFCLPLMIGVVFCAVLAAVGSALGGASLWAIVIMVFGKHDVPLVDRVAIFVQAGLYALLFLISIFGLIAAFRRSQRNLKLFSIFQSIYVFISLLSAALLFYSLLRPGDVNETERCRAHADGVLETPGVLSLVNVVCEKGTELLAMKITVMAFVLFVELFVIYAVMILPSLIEEVEFGQAAKIPDDIESLRPHFKKRTSSFFSSGTIGTLAKPKPYGM